jgi:predicted Zn-dependent protease
LILAVVNWNKFFMVTNLINIEATDITVEKNRQKSIKIHSNFAESIRVWVWVSVP